MSVCVACVAGNIDPPAEATVTVLGTEYCNSHGVAFWQMSITPGAMRRTMRDSSMTSPPNQQ